MFSELVPPTSTSAFVPANVSGTISVRSSRTASIASVADASPSTGTERSATLPSAERSISPSRSEDRRRGVVRSRSSAARTSVARCVRRRRSRPDRGGAAGSRARARGSPASRRSGREASRRRSCRCPARGRAARAPRARRPRAPGSAPGRRSTRRTIAPQKRPSGLDASSDRRPTIGMRSALTLSPSSPSSAGRSVSAATTETIPTRIAPTARLRMIEFGTSSIPNIAITKTRAAEEHRPARGRARRLDRGELSRPLRRAPRGSGRRRTASSRSRARAPCP